jgi:hypothetical protein
VKNAVEGFEDENPRTLIERPLLTLEVLCGCRMPILEASDGRSQPMYSNVATPVKLVAMENRRRTGFLTKSQL